MKNLSNFDSFFEKKIIKKTIKKAKKVSKKVIKKSIKPKDTIEIIIAKKKLFKETKDSYTFLTTTYGGKFFNIPKSQVISKSDSSIKINDVYKEPAYKIVITEYIFDKIFQEFLERMDDNSLIINH